MLDVSDKNIKRIRLMISFPSDVKEEIECIKRCVNAYNENEGISNDIFIELTIWKNVYPSTSGHAQEIINDQITYKCDILFAIIWKRMGTPTQKYSSGTEEEIMLCHKRGKHVSIYFSDVPSLEIDDIQYQKVKDFRYKIESEHFGLYKKYYNYEEFEDMIKNDLSSIIFDMYLSKSRYSIISNSISKNYSEKTIIDRDLKDKLGFILEDIENASLIYDFRTIDSKIDHYIDIAKEGDKIARFNLGLMYYFGYLIDSDENESIRWLKMCAEDQNTKAQLYLGSIYESREKYNPENLIEAFKWYLKSAEQGNADAKNNLGNMYYIGRGIDKNPEESFKLYIKAAEQGSADAMFNLGNMYVLKKDAIKIDFEEGIKWYSRAASLSHSGAENNLATMYMCGNGVDHDYNKAFGLYMKSAEQGNVSAIFSLGNMYRCGDGIKTNYEKALKWYIKAAEQGHTNAQVNIGSLYKFGQGVEKNPEEAFKWYLKAAEQGNALAQGNIGSMYKLGEGVEKNPEEAFKWHLKAAEQGISVAQCNDLLLF